MAEKWLVIDDSATIQRVIKLAFQDHDVQITEADSIQEALRELMRAPYSLVIADAALAGVQSVQDFSRLQQTAPVAAYVILEGSYDHIDENQFRGAGFRHFLKKPFDAQQLISITREALGRVTAHRSEKDKEDFAPPPPTGFSLDVPARSPPPPPSSHSSHSSLLNTPPRSLHEELENPFDGTDGFDLGLGGEPEPSFKPKPSPISHDELFDSRQLRGKIQAIASDMIAADTHFEKEKERERSAPLPLLEEGSYTKNRESSYNPLGLTSMLEPMLKAEMEKIVRQTVEDYCRKNFADLAREYLSREIEKLSAERTRLLVDK
ncbi:MAG: response regulator [Bdellovibrionota bacterium]